MKNHTTKLYNLIFPIWLIWLVPITWIIVLPGNFIIDLLVVTLTMKYLKVENVKANVKQVILKVYLFGFLADFIGTIIMLLSNLLDFDQTTSFGKWWHNYIVHAVSYNPLDNIYSILWVTICVILTGILIYLFNNYWCLKKANLTPVERKKVALSLALFTAPYLFYMPTKYFF